MLRSVAIEKEVLCSLLRSFENVKSQYQVDDSSNELLTKVNEEMQRLKNLHDLFKEEEEKARKKFMEVVRNANKILNEFKSGNYGTLDAEIVDQLKTRLHTVQTEFHGIRNKMAASIREVPSPNSGLQASQSVPSASSSTSRGVIENPRHLSLLKVTFNNIDAPLKRCLICLSYFPENQNIEKKLLIYWWIVEGIVPTASDGNSCFSKLLDLDLIIPILRNRSQKVHSCMLHPLIRKLLVDLEGNSSEGHSRIRNAFLRKGGTLPGSSQDLLTVYNVDEEYLDIQESWFVKETPTSMIQLGWSQQSGEYHIEVTDPKFLNSMGICKKLKYLFLRGISRIEYLPDSIGNLVNLLVLDLRACHNLEKLSLEIKSLKNLEYLDVSECYLLEEMPKGLEHLSKLEVLKGFVIASSRSKNPGRLGELTKLTKLRKLSITISQESAPSANEFEKIGEIKALVSLTITWGSKESEMNFTFPPDLQKLDLCCFLDKSLPESISPTHLKSLKKLYLSGGFITTLGSAEGWQVEILCVNFLTELSYKWEEIERCFQAVKLVKRHKCPHLNNWPCDDIHGIWTKTDTLEVNTGAAVPLASTSSKTTESA